MIKRGHYLFIMAALVLCACQKAPEPIKVTAITLDKNSIILTEDGTEIITATVYPSNAENQKVYWTTNHPDIAVVDNGIVTAVKEGNAIITATSDSEGKTATCSVTVKSKIIAVESVSLNKTESSLVVGEKVTLAAIVKPDDATSKIVTWNTTDASVATVQDGVVTAIKIGSATITAKVEDKTATCTISVIDEMDRPLTFTSNGSTTITLQKKGTPYDITLEYKLNNGSWTSYKFGTAIPLNDEDQIAFQAGESENLKFNVDYNNNYNFNVSGTGTIAASGNIMSLVNQSMKSLTIPYNKYFCFLFRDCTLLTQAPKLPATSLDYQCYWNMFYGCTRLTKAPELPATSLAKNCYVAMFSGCTSLTQAPKLPATSLDSHCYWAMFSGCTSLTQAPELPATTLAGNCYSKMFSGCISLTIAPKLPATTLAEYCYNEMFKGCTGLTQTPELPATSLANNCYMTMFSGCTSLTQAPKLPATSLAWGCYGYMFLGCTGLTQAPELPATTLVNCCYSNMFQGCTGLTQAPELPATTLSPACYQYMFSGCTSLTQAPVLPASTLEEYCYNEMFDGCTKLNYVKALFTTTPSKSYTAYWLLGVSSTGVFVKSKNASWNVTGSNGIPQGWTVQTE